MGLSSTCSSMSMSVSSGETHTIASTPDGSPVLSGETGSPPLTCWIAFFMRSIAASILCHKATLLAHGHELWSTWCPSGFPGLFSVKLLLIPSCSYAVLVHEVIPSKVQGFVLPFVFHEICIQYICFSTASQGPSEWPTNILYVTLPACSLQICCGCTMTYFKAINYHVKLYLP